MRQPDNLPAFCRVHRNGRPLIGYLSRISSCFARLALRWRNGRVYPDSSLPR